MIGKNLAHYRIVEKIGAGGMGEVYRASDSELGRDVALKLLPAEFARDTERMARFQREAQVLASLNHPGIASIFGIERSGDTTALVLELVEGPTLEDRIRSGPVPPDEATAIARGIAGAVEYAHERGIVHRDLKPANVKLGADGRVKVLDFGLAKALDTAPASGSGRTPVSSPTLTSPVISSALTGANVILGTAAYMSPEQARGKPVDRRADVWAFGVILFEMLTGRRLFGGETVSDTLAAVLKVEPDWSLLPDGVARPVHRVLRRCLAKDPNRRLRSVADAALELEEAAADSGSASGTAPASSRGRAWIPWAIAAGLAVALAIRMASDPPPGPRPAEAIHLDFQLTVGDHVTSFGPPAPSPDGRRIAYRTNGPSGSVLWIRSFDDFEPIMVAEDAGIFPFWSPDSRELAYANGDELRAWELSTGSSRRVCEIGRWTRGGYWGEDGTILFTPDDNSPLYRVDAAGGVPVAVTALDSTLADCSHRFPVELPGGERFLFTLWSNNPDVASEHGGIWAATRDGRIVRRVLADASACRYVDPGWLLLHRDGKLVTVPFDPETLEARPPGHVVAPRVLFNEATGSVGAGVCAAGVLAYAEGSGEARPTDLVWLDRSGSVVQTLYDEYVAEYLRISPSGRYFAGVLRTPTGNPTIRDLWVGDLERRTLTRLTRGQTDSWSPRWSRDETRIVFTNRDSGREALYSRDIFGTGPREPLFQSDSLDLEVTDWSVDGRYLLVNEWSTSRTAARIGCLELDTGRLAEILAASFRQANGLFSPDGKWIVYESNESGEREVCVSPFPEASRRWQISRGGGRTLSWSRDGREILYENDRRVWAVAVDPTAADLAPSVPEVVFDLPERVVDLEAASDHERFLASIARDDGEQRPLRVIRNWTPAGS